MTYYAGDTITMTVAFDADPVSVVFLFTSPGGERTTFVYGTAGEAVKDSDSHYHCTRTTAAYGTWEGVAIGVSPDQVFRQLWTLEPAAQPEIVDTPSLLCSVQEYRDITSDTTTSGQTIIDRLVRSEVKIAAYLNRGASLQEATTTETVRVGWDGFAYPERSPITAISDGGILDPLFTNRVNISTSAVRVVNTGAYNNCRWLVPITYTAGWTHETVPQPIREAIAKVAQALGQPSTLATVPGITVHSLDQGYTLPTGAGASIDAYVPGLSSSIDQWRIIAGIA